MTENNFLSLIIFAPLAGAVINSLRHERDDTGALPTDG